MKLSTAVRTTLFAVSFAFGQLILQSVPCLAQVNTASGDANALLLAQVFLANTSGKITVQSFRATGTALRFSGGETTSGSVQVESLGLMRTRIDVDSDNGVRSEMRGANSNGGDAGAWITSAGSHPVTFRNLYQETTWFFPALTSLGQITDSSLNFSFVGNETWNGESVLHVRVVRTVRGSTSESPSSTFTTEYYLDPASRLLLGMGCMLYPDSGANVEILREVHYANYIETGGVMVPTQIDRYLNGTKELSLTLSGVQINPSLPQADFQVN
jgi:hypothetical protein